MLTKIMETSNCHYIATTPKLAGIGEPSTSCSYYNYDIAASKKQRQNIAKWNSISIPASILIKQKLSSSPSPTTIQTTSSTTTPAATAASATTIPPTLKNDEDYEATTASSSASSSVMSDGNMRHANEDDDDEDDGSVNHHNNADDDDDNGEDDDYYDDNDSEHCNEIPIWVRGEPRWISGVTDQTTCYDLIEALLVDEDTFGPLCNELRPRDFVIIERWRKVEQILSSDTKIWKIWSAWGKTQPEVKLSLHHIESHSRLPNSQQTSPYLNGLQIGDGDSGRGSPTGSINSAIERRRRHRASKSTSAWLTQAHTVHPKSHKSTIEKLMKLILEQGETIQQQLSKLRDKELQISQIEEEQHQLREKEHGKNYLLETYLNGLHEAIDDREVLNGNSDSGINTEDTASPDTALKSNRKLQQVASVHDVMGLSEREQSLIKKHETIKVKSTSSKNSDTSSSKNGDTLSQIEMLENIVSLNKKLQHEEELLLRLTVKLRRYECENPMLTEDEIKNEIDRVNGTIQQTSGEQVKTEQQIKIYDEVLKMKTHLLEQLKDEIDHGMDDECAHDRLIMTHTPDIQLADEPYRSNNILLPPPLQFSNYPSVQPPPLPLVGEQPVYFNGHEQLPGDFLHMDGTSGVSNSNSYRLVKSLNLLEKCDQRIQNNNNDNNFYLNSNLKIGPKKMLINNSNNNSNSNNIINNGNNNSNNIRNCNLLQNTSSNTINMGVQTPTVVGMIVGGGEYISIPNGTTNSCSVGKLNRNQILVGGGGGSGSGSVNGGGYDSNSDTGISSMGEGDMSQLGTLV